MSSQFDADIPVASAPILMLSLPETQDTPQDVFLTPPEESSFPSSVDVDPCAVNEAAYLDSQTQGSVDLSAFSEGSHLGKDSKLGFSQAQLSQEIVTDLLSNYSPGNKVNGLGKVPEPHFEEVRVSEREISDLGESPLKKLKPLEQNFGKLVSDAVGESVENVMGFEREDFCREISVDKVINYEEKYVTEVVPRRVLPVSIEGEATTEVKSSEVNEKANHDLFDILKVLAEEDTDDEDEDEDNDNLSDFMKAVKESGITFPRPRWWPDHFKSVFPEEKERRDK